MAKIVPIRLSEARTAYTAYMVAAGGSPSTARNAGNKLAVMQRSFGKVDPWVSTLDGAWLGKYLYGPGGRHLAVNTGTMNTERSLLRGFYKWCFTNHYVETFELGSILKSKKPVPTEKRFLPPSRFGELLSAAGAAHPRDRAVVAVGLWTLSRASEVMPVKIRHLDLERRKLSMYNQKLRFWDDKPIMPPLAVELERWLNWYKRDTGSIVLDPDWYLFPAKFSPGNIVKAHRDGRVVHPGKLRPTDMVTREAHIIVQRALTRMGLPTTHEGVHSLRRAAARALFDHLTADPSFPGSPIQVVQSMLGHANMATTEIYLGEFESRKLRDNTLRDLDLWGDVHAEDADVYVFPGAQTLPEAL